MGRVSSWWLRSAFAGLIVLGGYTGNAVAGSEPAATTFQQWADRHQQYQRVAQAAFNAVTLTENTECVDATTQLQINQCLGRRLTAAREQYAIFFKNLQGALDPAPGEAADDRRQLLQKNQETWTRYRNAMLQAVGAEWEGGSGRPAAVERAETSLIRSRMLELDMAYEAALHR